MRLIHQDFGDWYSLCDTGKECLVKVQLVLMVKIRRFWQDLQADKLTGQKDALWVIENIPGTVK